MIKDGDAGEFSEQVRILARHCLQNILRELEERVAENGSLENLQRRLAWLLSVIVRYESNVTNPSVVDLLADALACIGRSFETRITAVTVQIFRTAQLFGGKGGLPPSRWRNYLEYCISFAFSLIFILSRDDDSIPPDKRTVASCSKLNARVIWKSSAMFTYKNIIIMQKQVF
jgi:hypothetical protein